MCRIARRIDIDNLALFELLVQSRFIIRTIDDVKLARIHFFCLRVCVCGHSETSFENTGQETSMDVSQTLGSIELHNDLTHYYNVPGVSAPTITCINKRLQEHFRKLGLLF